MIAFQITRRREMKADVMDSECAPEIAEVSRGPECKLTVIDHHNVFPIASHVYQPRPTHAAPTTSE